MRKGPKALSSFYIIFLHLALAGYEELHLHPRKLYHVVISERVRLAADRIAVYHWMRAFDMGDEVALRTSGDYCHLHSEEPRWPPYPER